MKCGLYGKNAMANSTRDTKAAELLEKMGQLRDVYIAQLPEKIRQIELLWKGLLAKWEGEAISNLHRQVHSLTGSGATFGVPELSASARQLEQLLKEIVATERPASEEQRVIIQAGIESLQHLAKEAAAQPHQAVMATMALSPEPRHVLSKRVLVIDADHAVGQELALQLSYFGYEVQVYTQLEAFRLAVKQHPDAIVLADICFPSDDLGGVHVVSAVQQERGQPLSVLFISSRDDVVARLEAARAGGLAYFTKPINFGDLIDKLDELTSAQPQEDFRVLIVDDSVSLAKYHAAILEQAGMVTRVINNPLEVMQPLLEFAPDLILMDVYMPECSGLELAKVIRQLEAFVSTPIVYLSAEKDLDKQSSAMSLGGDDFLVKPIQPQHLVASLSNRIERSRLLRSFMVRDSLTGLLNHTAIKDQLEREVARAKRMRTPLSFAMVDIDFFKTVNDTYGHPVGDRVIKSLSRLLKQRLRETDVVGRYGGEEFAVIMSGTDGHTAMNVLNEIRTDFSQLRHLSADREFSVTFSCGVAELANFVDATRIAEAADKALYEAKHAGRNQLALARK